MEIHLDKEHSPQSAPQTALHQPTRAFAAPAARLSCWALLLRWVLWLGFAYFALSGWVRMGYAIQNWYWLNSSGIRPGPLYLIISGGIWGLVGLAALVWIVFHWPWYRLAGLGTALFFALTYWIDRLFIATGGGGNTLFAAILTLLLLAYTFLVLRPLDELRSVLYKR
jgi:hypothetical protein